MKSQNLQPDKATHQLGGISPPSNTIVRTLTNALCGVALSFGVISTAQAAINIYSDPATSACGTATVPCVLTGAEPATLATFQIVSDTDIGTNVEVTFDITGNATGADYLNTAAGLGSGTCASAALNCILITAAAAPALDDIALNITPIDDALLEGSETVTVTLLGAVEVGTNAIIFIRHYTDLNYSHFIIPRSEF